MIGGRQVGSSVNQPQRTLHALTSLQQAHQRVLLQDKSSIQGRSVTSSDSLCEAAAQARDLHVECDSRTRSQPPHISSSRIEQNDCSMMSQRMTIKYPGSMLGNLKSKLNQKQPFPGLQRHSTATRFHNQENPSRAASCADSIGGGLASSEEDSSTSVVSSNNQMTEWCLGDSVVSKYVASSTSPIVFSVESLAKTIMKSAGTATETEEALDEEADAGDKLKDRRRRRKRKPRVTVNLAGTRYRVVRDVVENIGFLVRPDDDLDCFLIWTDAPSSNDKISELKPYQHINHFPGMSEICRKDWLARNMARMARTFPDQYNFVPKTWILPSDYAAFQTYAHNAKKNKRRGKTFIVKPANGAMGNGIQLIRCPEKVPSNEHIVVQEYINKPFLVDGFKCDMRIYVLITSCDPLRIFLFNDGLLRLSTEPYVTPTDGNIDHLYMHLTNYSINKHSTNYRKDEAGTSGSKRSLRYFTDYLRRKDHDATEVWNAITDLIIKTMIVAHPHIFHAYRMCRPSQPLGADSVCFEILGFDVMLDRKLRPWLIEVNRSPSFGTNEQLDYDIKSAVIEDALRLVHIRSKDKKKNMAEEKAQIQRRLMRSSKRGDSNQSVVSKRRESLERKKDELYSLLERVQRDDEREEYENKNVGRYRRVFPPIDRLARVRYANLLTSAYQLFLSGRQAQSLDLEIQRLYSCDLKEYEIRDLLAQYETDELLDQQPTSQSLLSPTMTKIGTTTTAPDISAQRRLQEETSRVQSKQLLESLRNMQFTIPNKTQEETSTILIKLQSNWESARTTVEQYWLQSLDHQKRSRVIDIVRINVRAVLHRHTIEDNSLQRLFNSLFTRMLWNNGRGLSDCFVEEKCESWRALLREQPLVFTPTEIECCSTLVTLCRQCLLVVHATSVDHRLQQQLANSASGTTPSMDYDYRSLNTDSATGEILVKWS